MIREEKEALVASVPFWWHSIDFGDGVVSKGQITPDGHRFIASFFPNDLNGKTVLDVGAWDGYYSFECEKRGAQVTAIDTNMHMRGHKGFEVAKQLLCSQVEHYEMDFLDVSDKLNKTFDVVLFLGVLYHLKDPLLALEALYKITDEVLILETHYIELGDDTPLMRFYPGTELNNDPTNWWGPNIAAVVSMLEVAGFKDVEVVSKTLLGTAHDRAIIRAYKSEGTKVKTSATVSKREIGRAV
jgi:tRNA (mo5U34)-methyltransferase